MVISGRLIVHAPVDQESERELAKQRLANDRDGCWVTQMQQIELLSRCLPYAVEAKVTEYWCVTETFAPGDGENYYY